MPNKTKIICTIGPQTLQGDTLQRLASAGMAIARLNFSHGNHRSHGESIARLRKLSEPIAIMLDTQGPEIRTADREQALSLVEGDQVLVFTSLQPGQEGIVILYDALFDALTLGDELSLDNGLINLEVLEKQPGSLLCLVKDGGELGSRRHVNLPGVTVNLPAVTEKDKADILFAIEQNLDFIALSFVRDARAILQVRELLKQYRSPIQIIAKIEEQQGIEHLDEIIAVADGIMVARGDLGIEVGIECVPSYQRDMVKRCAAAGKTVIIATHLLESMIVNPIPTRAEVSDVATAVHQQADAIMLSGETSIGEYPVRCVDYLQKIIFQAERHSDERFAQLRAAQNPRELLAFSAVELAENSNAKGVLVVTKHGLMATYAASAKPFNSHIFAFTFDAVVQRSLSLQRAVSTFVLDFNTDAEAVVQNAVQVLKEKRLVEKGDRLVILSDFLLASSYDSIQLRLVE